MAALMLMQPTLGKSCSAVHNEMTISNADNCFFHRPTSEGFQIADEKGTAEVLGVSELNLIIVRSSSFGDCVLESGI